MTKLQSEGLSVEGVVCHVGKQEDRAALLEKTVDKFGGLDILVSNAAVNPYFGTMLDCPEDAWDKIFDINVKVSFLLFKECVPLMQVMIIVGKSFIVYKTPIEEERWWGSSVHQFHWWIPTHSSSWSLLCQQGKESVQLCKLSNHSAAHGIPTFKLV